MAAAGTGSVRGRSRQVLAIAVAMGVSSVLGFVFLAIASRWMTPVQYATFMAAWGLVFGLAAAMLSTEQEVARITTLATMRGAPVPVSTLQVAIAATALATTALVVVAISPAGQQALGSSVPAGSLVWLSAIGFAIQYLVRGVALGRRDTRTYVIVILGDGGLRVIAIAVLALTALQPSIELALCAVAAGCFSWVLVLPWAVRGVSRGSGRVPWRSATAAIGSLMVGSGFQSVLLTAYPTLVASLVGLSDELATYFGVVTLSRIPLVAVSPIQSIAVPEATRLIHSGRSRMLVSLLLKLAAFGLGAVALSAAFGYVAGPWLMRAFLGSNYAPASGVVVAATLAAGCVMAVAMLQVAMLVALQRYPLVIATWASGVAAAVAVILWWPGDAVTRATLGFVVGSLTAYVVSAAAIAVSWRTAHPADEPATPDVES